MIVDGGGVDLALPSAASPDCGHGLDRGMGEGQDLQGPLGDGGQMGETLFVCIEVVDVVPKKASVALQTDARTTKEMLAFKKRISKELMLISGLYVVSANADRAPDYLRVYPVDLLFFLFFITIYQPLLLQVT